MNIINLC